MTIESGINALHDRLDFRWATLLRRDGGPCAPMRCAPETLHRRPSGAAIPQELRGAGRPSVPALAQQGRLFSSTRRAWRSGGTGGSGEPPAQKHGAVCADRLAKKRTTRASEVFIGTINIPPITRESPLRQSAVRKTTAVGLPRPQILELKGLGATRTWYHGTLLSSRVEKMKK